MNGTGKYERVKVTGYLSNNQINVEAVPKGLKAKTIWGINPPDLARRLFRAITVSDKGDGTYSIIAVQHVPEKEAIVDQGVKFEPLPDTPLGGYIPSVENLSVEISADSDNWQVEANWTTATAIRGVDFILKLTQAGRIVGTAKTQENRYRIGNLPQGNYLLSVVPQNNDGQKGEQASVSFDINPPPPPSYIDVEPGFFSLGIIPHVGGQNALRLQYEFWFSEKQIANINEVELLAEYLGNGTIWVIQGRKLKAGQTYYVYVRTVNPVGKSQFVEANGRPEDRADEILEVIGDKFLSTEAGQELQKQIDFNKDNLSDLQIDNDDFKQKVISIDRELGAVNEAVMTVTQMTTENYWELKEESAKGKASVKRLEQVQADFTVSQAKYQQEVATQFEHVAADVLNVQESLAKSNEAFAQEIRQVRADLGETNNEVGAIKGRVITVETATADLKQSQAKLEQSTTAKFGEMTGYITNINQTITNLEFSFSEALMQTNAQVNETNSELLKTKAEVTRLATATATNEKATSELAENVKAQHEQSEAEFVDVRKSIAEKDKAQSERTEQVRAELGKDINANKDELSKTNAVVTQHTESIATLGETTTQIKQTQQSQHEETQASIGKLTETTANTDKALTEAKEQSESRFEDNEASINHIEQTMANTEGSQVEAIGQLTAQQNVQGTEILRAKASITRIDKVVADNNHAFAQSIERLDAQFDETHAAIEKMSKVEVDHQGNAFSIISFKAAVLHNGQYYDAKMLVSAEVKNGKVVTQIGFSADTFGIFNPSSGKLEPVFFVENGQVFIDEALINKAVIGSIVVQTDMRSPNYVPGKTGMRIDMKNSVFETNSHEGDHSVIRNSRGDYFKYKGISIVEVGWFL